MIARLKAADAVLFGKTNMDEFAMGSSTENSAYGPTRNPWDESRDSRRLVGRLGRGRRRRPGAAVARHRHRRLDPAAGGLCGVVGLKPTYGRVSRYGLIAFASSLDQIGPFAHDLADTALLLKVDRRATIRTTRRASTSRSPTTRRRSTRRPNRCGSAWSASSSARGSTPRSSAAVREAVRVYEKAGATIKEVSLPHSKYGVPAYYIVAPAECSSNLARYDGTIYGHRAEDFSPRYPGEEDLAAAGPDDDGQPRRGLRRRGQAADHAGHLRPLGRLRRPVLQQGPARSAA